MSFLPSVSKPPRSIADTEGGPHARRNLVLYYVVSALSQLLFFMPIIVLHWHDLGLSHTQVYGLQAIYALAVVVLELPTGALADRLSQRFAVRSAMLLMTVAVGTYYVAADFWMFVLAQLIWALATTLFSGADSALAYVTLERLGDERRFAEVEGRARALGFAALAVAAIVGGQLGAVDYRLAVGISAIPLALSLVASFFMVPTPETPRGEPDAVPYRELLGRSVRFLLDRPRLLWTTVYLALLLAGTTVAVWFYQPYLKRSGLGEAEIGLAFAFFHITAAVFSRLAPTVERRCGRARLLTTLAVLVVVPLLPLALVHAPICVLFIVMHQLVRGVARPLLRAEILHRTGPRMRATVISISNAIYRLIFAAMCPLLGLALDGWGFERALLAAAVVLAALFVGMAIWWQALDRERAADDDVAATKPARVHAAVATRRTRPSGTT